MASLKNSNLQSILLIALIAIGASTIMSGSYELSFERIQKNQQGQELELVTQIIKSTTDEQILEKIKSPTESNISILPTPELTYKITKNGILNTFIFNAHSSQGYNGSIHMLVGINMDGSITGVRITDHRETPGLGDKIDIEKSEWILNFESKSLTNPELPSWRVTKDGGHFDGFTSATVTARAVIHTVRDTLIYFENHKDTLISHSSKTNSINNDYLVITNE